MTGTTNQPEIRGTLIHHILDEFLWRLSASPNVFSRSDNLFYAEKIQKYVNRSLLDLIITYPVILPDFLSVHYDSGTKRTCRIYATSCKTNLKAKHKVKL